MELEDHPLDYGDFEGTIPQGEYGGGTVHLWDRGYWEPEGTKTPQQALADGDFKLVLAGQRLQGGWVLVRLKHDRTGGKRTNWLLIGRRGAEAAFSAGNGSVGGSAGSSLARIAVKGTSRDDNGSSSERLVSFPLL